MIAVDTNVIAALLLPGREAEAAERAYREDPVWVSPLLWRSEFANVLVVGMRAGRFGLSLAAAALRTAETLMEGREFAVPGDHVLRTAVEAGLSAYDSEFVVLARDLDISLLTLDRRILEAAPDIAIPLTGA